MNSKNLKAGDITKFRIFKNGYSVDRIGILIERFRNGWIAELENGKNGLTKVFSPDADERLDYRLIGRPQ